jgi:hypothetical protein
VQGHERLISGELFRWARVVSGYSRLASERCPESRHLIDHISDSGHLIDYFSDFGFVHYPGSFEGQFEVSGPAKVDRNGSNVTEELEPFSLCAPPKWCFPISNPKCDTTAFWQIPNLF